MRAISQDVMIVKAVAVDPDATRAVGEAFGEQLFKGDVLNLIGDLGAGKTLFVKGIARSLGVNADDVQSPSFTLIREYEGDIPLYHLDLYRLEDTISELEHMGYEHYFDPREAVTAIEWGDRAEGFLPPRRFDVSIDTVNAGRLITIKACGQSKERVQSLCRQLLHWSVDS